jgi:hypothetical protein
VRILDISHTSTIANLRKPLSERPRLCTQISGSTSEHSVKDIATSIAPSFGSNNIRPVESRPLKTSASLLRYEDFALVDFYIGDAS